MAAKMTFELEIAGNEDAVDAFVGGLAALPAHKWIPLSQIREDGQATLTNRQAGWLGKQVSRKVKGSSIVFTPVAEPAA